MKVKFFPSNVEVDIKMNESVLHVAQENGVHIQSICKGVPSCTECRVKIKEGEYNVIPPNQKELSLIGNSYYVDQRRLACQLKCFGDVVIDLTEQVEKAETAVGKRKPRGAREGYDSTQSQAKQGNIILEEVHVEPVQAAAEIKTAVTNVKYESKLHRAEKELFEEETKRALAELKAKKVKR